jgi:hypothetical protein
MSLAGVARFHSRQQPLARLRPWPYVVKVDFRQCEGGFAELAGERLGDLLPARIRRSTLAGRSARPAVRRQTADFARLRLGPPIGEFRAPSGSAGLPGRGRVCPEGATNHGGIGVETVAASLISCRRLRLGLRWCCRSWLCNDAAGSERSASSEVARVGWLGRREVHVDVESAFGAGSRGDLGVVGLGDGLDDGEAEAVAVGVVDPLAAALLEGPEESLYFSGRDRWAGIAHGDG